MMLPSISLPRLGNGAWYDLCCRYWTAKSVMEIRHSIYYYEPGWKNVPSDFADFATAGYNIRNSSVANVYTVAVELPLT